MRRLIRTLIARALLLLPVRLSGVCILMYHSIASTESDFITDEPDAFAREAAYIARRGFRTVFASELPGLLASGDLANTVCLTFDDGYRDNYDNALPVLKQYGLKATIFLPTGLISKNLTDSREVTRDVLSEKEVREMTASGLVEFLPHGRFHRDLRTLDDTALDEEITESARKIAELSGKEPKVFAYPWGSADDRVRAAVKRHGFTAAVGTKPGIMYADADPFALPRNSLGRISTAELTLKLSDRLETYLAIKRLV